MCRGGLPDWDVLTSPLTRLGNCGRHLVDYEDGGGNREKTILAFVHLIRGIKKLASNNQKFSSL